MDYQQWLKEYVRRVQEPQYTEDVYPAKLYISEKPISIELVIRRKRSQKLPLV